MKPTPAHKKAVGWLAAAIVAVGAFEGYSAFAYPDIIGVPTICYGETKGVKLGDYSTREQCDEKLAKRLMEFNSGVNRCLHSAPLTDNQRVAFVSLAYNIGVTAFCASSIPKRITAGDYVGACNTIMDFNRVCVQHNLTGKCVKKKVIQGLVNRRTVERDLCLKEL